MSADLIREGRGVSYSLRHLFRQPELAATIDRLADALERAEKELDEAAAATLYLRSRPAIDVVAERKQTEAEFDRLRAENERLEDRVTQLEERLRHMADDFSARDVPASVPPGVR